VTFTQLAGLLAALAVGVVLGVLWASVRAVGRERGLAAERDTAEARRVDAQRSYDQLLGQIAREHDHEQGVASLVAPLRDTLGKVELQLRTAEHQRSAAQAALREQVDAVRRSSDELRREASTLSTALRAPQVRGRWGEQQLERIVEAAGMVPHCDYVTQASSTTDDGTLRPDLLVRLAGGKQVVVDAKVPFAGYLDAMDARDEASQRARLEAHARHVRDHVTRLAAKAYWERFAPSPEFVVMFVPSDSFLSVALEHDPTLLEHAFTRDVVIATPSTLIALLRTVAYAWRQDAVADNAREVLALGRELHGRLATMGGHLGQLGRELGSAVTAYNRSVGSLETRVLVTARRLADLHVVDERLEAPAGVSDVPRPIAAPELLASDQDTLITLLAPRAAGD
jgi:DNA recombination protein RmuC